MPRTPFLIIASFTLSFTSACGPGEDEEEEFIVIIDVPDSGPPEPVCVEHPLPDALSIIEGGRVRLDDPNGAIVSLVGEGASAWREEDAWVVRMPYGVSEVVLDAELDCEVGARSVRLEVELEPIRWEEGVTWQDDGGPSAREHAPLWIFEDAPDHLYLYGGYTYRPRQFSTNTELWRFDLVGGGWERVDEEGEGPDFAGGRHAVDQAVREVVFLGGDAPHRDDVNASQWRLRVDSDGNASWSDEPIDAAPATSVLGGLVFDARRARHVLMLGLTGGTQLLSSLIVRGSGEGWHERAQGARSPSLRYGFAYAHDRAADRVVVLSGAQAPSAFDPVNPAHDLWALDLESLTWEPLQPEGTFRSGRRNGCWAHDTTHDRLVLWGGTADAMTSVSDMVVVDLDPGRERIHTLTFEAGPEARASCSGTFDAARGHALFGLGNNERALFTDLQRLVLD